MINAFRYAQPKIPSGLMHEMFQIMRSGGHYDPHNGGQWVPGEGDKVPFRGVILPVSNKDLMREDIGTYGKNSQKVYTNGFSLEIGGKIYDPAEDRTYTVTQELGYNSIHPLKRYLIERKEEAEE